MIINSVPENRPLVSGVSISGSPTTSLENNLNVCRTIVSIIAGILGIVTLLTFLSMLITVIPMIRDTKKGFKIAKEDAKSSYAYIIDHKRDAKQKYSELRDEAGKTLRDAKGIFGAVASEARDKLESARLEARDVYGEAKIVSQIGLEKLADRAVPILSAIASNTAAAGASAPPTLANTPTQALKNGLTTIASNFALDAVKNDSGSSLASFRQGAQNVLVAASKGAFQGAGTTPDDLIDSVGKLADRFRGAIVGAAQGAATGSALGSSNLPRY